MFTRAATGILSLLIGLPIHQAVAQEASRYPLLVVEQNRASIVKAVVDKWAPAMGSLLAAQRKMPDELGDALWRLRADRLLAASLAGSLVTIQDLLAESASEAGATRTSKAPVKSLGDATDDLSYTPLTPCRIVDTRNALGPLAGGTARGYQGYNASSFAAQGGASSSCGIPNNVAALAMTATAVQPAAAGFVILYASNTAAPNASTVNFAAGEFATATGAIVPVDNNNNNGFAALSPASTVDLVVDVVGYFKAPGDATGLSIFAHGQRVVRYESLFGGPSITAGNPGNTITASDIYGAVVGATIAGGGGTQALCGINFHQPCFNSVTSSFSTVGGGAGNTAGGINIPSGSTVAGGYSNSATGILSTIAGGLLNTAMGRYTFIGGGSENVAINAYSTVAGGFGNRANNGAAVGGGNGNDAEGVESTISGGGSNMAIGLGSTVGGGFSNVAQGDHSTVVGGDLGTAAGVSSVVVGGIGNNAYGDYSFVAGRGAFSGTGINGTPHPGAFVWADSSNFSFFSSAPNEFAARATGGVRFVLGIDGSGSPTWTCSASNGNGWACSSDRNLKENFAPVNGRIVLDRVAALPLYFWNATGTDPGVRHIGPTAQDFMAAFAVGNSDTMIGMQDADGVALAAIQGLRQLLGEKDEELAKLKKRLEAIELRLGLD